ncbi:MULTISPECIES: hypothetical protein [unclassified Nocardia]|uniref:hypothetical protein n=1 Tax=unclassified Nocardia TaxID=2637762 RepID=UPI001CE4395C|nr:MULTISPECIES: hypothetical protein [unclassified Nocardia]
MRLTIESISTRAVGLFAVMIAAAVVAGCDETPPDVPAGKVKNVEAELAVDPSDRAAVAGWADAIFVGTVEENLHTEVPETGIPETQFRVAVVDQLKGELPAKVVVNQLGGTNSRGEIIVVDNVPLIGPDKTYLFVTRYYAEKGWLTAATGLGTRELIGPEAEAAKRADNNPANRDAEPDVVKRMRDAIAHEKPFPDEATRPKLPDPASLPSAVTGIPTPRGNTSPAPTPTTSLPPAPTTSAQPHPPTTTSGNPPTPTS